MGSYWEDPHKCPKCGSFNVESSRDFCDGKIIESFICHHCQHEWETP